MRGYGVASLGQGWLVQGHKLGTLVLWSRVTAVALAQPTFSSAPHGAEFTHGCLCRAWQLGPAGVLWPSGYRLCLAHPAAPARGFTIISPVSVLISLASPLLFYPRSLPSIFYLSGA